VKGVKDVKTSTISPGRSLVIAGVFTSFILFTSLGASVPQAPVFRSKVEIIQLDVSVLDKHRQPIKGLTESNFTVLEDGKPQKIVGFSTFDMDDAPPPATGWMRDVPPDVTTNDIKPESRLWVIVLDDAMIPQEPFSIKSAKEIARNIIEKLGPNDLTSIVFTGDNRKTQDFTSDKTKLTAALDRFNPGLTSYRFGLDTGARDNDLWFYQSAVRTLDSIADYLASIPNRRKAVFWISPGVPIDLCSQMIADDLSGRPVIIPNPRCGIPPPEMVELFQRLDAGFRRAQRANVTFYPIDPSGLDGMRQYLRTRIGEVGAAHKSTLSQDTLASTAANTGGRAIMNTNEFGPEIGEIFNENKSYYLLAIEPANPVADGKLHKLQVKVDRADVDVRTRSGYYAPEAVTKEDKKIAKSGMTPEAVALAKAMAGVLPTAGMPMRASAAAFAVPGQRLSTVTVVLGVRQPIPVDAANGRVTEATELLTSAFTPEGDPKGSQKHTAKIVLRSGANGEAAYEVLARIDLPAGRYQLRLAAHNTTAGKDGSVFVDVTVPDYSNIPFSASPVVLSAAPGRVSAPKDLFSSILPLVPTAEREFATTDKVTAFLRLYQSGQKPIDRVTVAMSIRNAQGQVEATETRSITADQFPSAAQQTGSDLSAAPLNRPGVIATLTQSPADKFANLALRSADVKYAIPMTKLSPGPHLLTMEASLGATTIRRDVRFEVK
jgi:VWFA-related protein